VTSPHHLSATMVTGRVHRMTELFGRLAPGANLDAARAELRAVHGAMIREHPEAYSATADFRIDAVPLRDQITSRARTVLLVLLAAAALVFVIACSNIVNLILARTVRREGELAVRLALGASAAAVRRTLLAESLLLCGAGALLGVLSARPLVAVLARYAARFSVRALDLTADSSLLWTGVALALLAAVLLAFVPRLPGASAAHGSALSSGGSRISGGSNRRLRVFAVTQIAASFVLLAGAVTLVRTLLTLQAVQTGFDTRRVLVLNVPMISYGRTPDQITLFYKEMMRRTSDVPGVDGVAFGSAAPWRDKGTSGPGLQFSGEGYVRAPGEEVSPSFFATLGVPILSGRDFNESDRRDSEPVVIVSQSLAQRMFPNQDAVNRHIMWTDPIMKFVGVSPAPRRIVGVAADVDDENVVPGPAFTVYHPFGQTIGGQRLFVHTRSNPYSLVAPITRIVREMSAEQPVERAATLEDIRAEVIAPDRLNVLVFGGFSAVALAIAVVGVAGVLAFSVSARTRELGIRLAIGSQPRQLLMGVLREGAVMAAIGIAVGAVVGYALVRLAGGYFPDLRLPGPIPIVASAVVLLAAASLASALPAIRAARIDAMQALRSE
jgi:putative ABC transport system permease protein